MTANADNPTPDTQLLTPYDAIADWYAASFLTGSPVHALALPALLDLAGDISGQDICDLACGQGIVARELARRGARVTGIDLSARLLEIARDDEAREPRGIAYRQDDAHSLATIPDAAFDGMICNLALMDIPDLDACLRSAHRALRPGGWLVLTLIHPCFLTPDSRWTGKAGGTVKREVRRYFEEVAWSSDNPHGVRGQVPNYHRTLSTYLNALCAAGFLLERALEPQPQDATAARVPGYAEVAVVLALRLRKGAARAAPASGPGQSSQHQPGHP